MTTGRAARLVGGTAAAAALLLLTLAWSCPRASAEREADSSISGSGLMATVRALCAPELEGRLAGGPGYLKAAEMMARRFAELGLEPAGGDGYFQHLTVEYNRIEAPLRLALCRDGEVVARFAPGVDFTARGFSGSGRVRAPVVFCGYGLSLPERGYDDYAGVDVGGRVVLAFKQPPAWTLDGQGWGEAHLPRPKARVAASHGAAALLLVSTPDAPQVQPPIGSTADGPGERLAGFPQLHVAVAVADRLLAGSGSTLLELQRAIDGGRQPRSTAVAAEVELEVNTSYVAAQDAVNVVGLLRGRDPGLAGEHVVIGAHLDHVGRQAGTLYPGANDNASGAAALLAVAEASAGGPLRPRRSLVFALFAGEEQGMVGSEAYVAHPALPLERVAAMLNLDCVGRGERLRLGGGGSSPRLWSLARAIDRRRSHRVVEESGKGGGADAEPFFAAGVPTLYFSATSGYDHLHLPTDTPDTLRRDLLEEATRLAFLTAMAVAEAGPAELEEFRRDRADSESSH